MAKESFREYVRRLHCSQATFDALARTAWELRRELTKANQAAEHARRNAAIYFAADAMVRANDAWAASVDTGVAIHAIAAAQGRAYAKLRRIVLAWRRARKLGRP